MGAAFQTTFSAPSKTVKSSTYHKLYLLAVIAELLGKVLNDRMNRDYFLFTVNNGPQVTEFQNTISHPTTHYERNVVLTFI